MMATFLLFVPFVNAAGVLADLAARNAPKHRFAVAFASLRLEEFLTRNDWPEFQRRVSSRIFAQFSGLVKKPLLQRLSILLASSVLSFAGGVLVGIAGSGPAQLLQAGFKNPRTPFPETLLEWEIEITSKTHALIPLILTTTLFNAVGFWLAYRTLKALSRHRGPISFAFVSLSGAVCGLGLFNLNAFTIEVFQLIGYLYNLFIQHRPTTFLMLMPQVTLLVAGSVALPMLYTFSAITAAAVARVALQGTRWVCRLLAAVVSALLVASGGVAQLLASIDWVQVEYRLLFAKLYLALALGWLWALLLRMKIT